MRTASPRKKSVFNKSLLYFAAHGKTDRSALGGCLRKRNTSAHDDRGRQTGSILAVHFVQVKLLAHRQVNLQ